MEQAASVNWLDIAVVVIILFSAGFAFLRGLVRELFSLAAWIGSALLSVWLYPAVQPWAREHIANKMVADAVASFGTFCATLIVLMLIGHFLAGLVRGQALTAIDRSLGFVFGFLRGVLVVSLLYLVVAWAWPQLEDQPEWIQHAKTRPLLESGAEMIKAMTPESARDKLAEQARKAEEGRKQAEEANRLLNQLTVPRPEGDEEAERPAYNEQQRGHLDQFIHQQD